jgi:ArsR family transcriptional regulator, arsenate/arsenite/antimonite-responsive transcriptional repressor
MISMPTAQQDLTAVARVFHALSDETRLALVRRLRSGEHCVCDLMDHLEAAQSRLSFHLKVLRDAGIVDCRREGRWAYYWLRPDAFDELGETLKVLAPTPGARASAAGRCCD